MCCLASLDRELQRPQPSTISDCAKVDSIQMSCRTRRSLGYVIRAIHYCFCFDWHRCSGSFDLACGPFLAFMNTLCALRITPVDALSNE